MAGRKLTKRTAKGLAISRGMGALFRAYAANMMVPPAIVAAHNLARVADLAMTGPRVLADAFEKSKLGEPVPTGSAGAAAAPPPPSGAALAQQFLAQDGGQ